MQRQTTIAKPAEITRKWYVIDATDVPLGRLASLVAVKLMGKDNKVSAAFDMMNRLYKKGYDYRVI